ncbi:MAG: hypothetical protein P1U40_07310, partial [Coxiellaceae bacterium]|nr:hypothetical protein [Coxiellaceae bacterium]
MGIGAKSFSSANDISSPVSRDMMGFRDENTISIEAAPDFSKQSLVSVVSKQAYDSYQPAIAVNTEIFNNAVPDSYYIGVQGPRIATVTDTLNAAFGQSVRASTLGVSTKGGLTNAFNSSLFAVSFAYQATGFSKSTEQLAIESANLTAKAQTVFNSGKIDSSEFMKEAINSTPTETISYVSEALPFAEILTPAEVAAPVEFVSEPLNDIVTEPVVSVEVEPIQETVVESGLLVSIRAAVIVAEVNDAPIVSSSTNFTSITEDQTNHSGQFISDIVSITDADSGASSGIAVHTIDSGNGAWQYSLDSGSTWTAIINVSTSNALLLGSNDKLRFVPDGDNSDSGNVQFYGWDQTSGVAGATVDASTRGGSTAFSTDSDTSSITVTAVNDAPTISSSINFTTITEDQTSNAGNDVSDLASIADVDSGASSGIAVHTLDSSNGTWQYSTDSGSTWTAVGQVSESNALLLASTDKLRFVPDGNNADSADVDFYAWDQTSGAAGTKVDASTRGDTTAFSTGTENSSITVSAVNDAPTISSSSNFTAITEDATANAGNDVSDLVSISDVDSGASSGIAVHTVDSSNGIWQYSTDSGSSWIAVGQVSTSNALLLASTDKLRFVPDGNNADSADVDFYAWDQTSGAAGTKVDASTRGDTTAFSTGTENSSITVSAVNDAPTISSSSNFTTITEDQTTNAGNDVSDLASIADVDSGASSGIAVHTIDSSNGTWQYSTDSGSSWIAVGQVSTSNALLLASTDKLRFVPDGNNADSADVDFYAWDQTSGAAGTKVDASTRGDTTAFSTGTENSSITVSAVNDAPTISSSSNFTAITEDATANAGNDVSDLVSISDVDSGASSGIAVHTVDSSNGIWQYSTDSGSSWIAVGQVSTSNALLLASTDKLRFVPDGNNADSADVDFYAWDQTSGAAGTKVDASTRGDTTAFSSGTENSSISVSAVNDAPTISSSSNFTAITEDATTNA